MQEESRLINDSSAIRSGQVRPSLFPFHSSPAEKGLLVDVLWLNKVFLAFAGAFAVASMFSRGRSKEPQRKR